MRNKKTAVVASFDENILPMQHDIDELTGNMPSEWSTSVLRSMRRRGFQIIILSSYAESMRPIVEEWLLVNQIPYDRLIMNADMGDDSETEDCAILRGRIFDQHVRDTYCVLFAVEGNPVIAASIWAARGINCL